MTSLFPGKRGSESEGRRGSATSDGKRGSISASQRGSVNEPNVASSLTPEALASIQSAELLDKDGKSHTWGELTGGKRVVVVFIRHFWCINCKEYCRLLAEQIPPSSLPEGTSLIIIGCGNSKPIKTYITSLSTPSTPFPYPIYAHPSLSLHKALSFHSNLGASKAGEEKAYEAALGGTVKRTVNAFKEMNFGDLREVGPFAQNGGEMLLEADGSCSFLHRMKHTADHTELDELARQVGAKHVPGQSMSEAMQCKA